MRFGAIASLLILGWAFWQMWIGARKVAQDRRAGRIKDYGHSALDGILLFASALIIVIATVGLALWIDDYRGWMKLLFVALVVGFTVGCNWFLWKIRRRRPGH